jgi:hypothetical protein
MVKGLLVAYKDKKRDGSYSKQTIPLIPSASVLLPEIPSLIPEAGCGQSPLKAIHTEA